ncbi:hypothetical protein [Methanoculleus sp. UBA303]|jgi:hypothetical protein|uniref:hypothetical protein n=1 Tax=Methanoculleus sp. UBA303 TaxID=1915497 RepID=UPI0025F5FE9F|nr:hypothetical protein [Methanoculleus sp. UBA303]
MVSFAAGRFSGVIQGALAGGGVFLLGRSGLLPDPVMTVAFLFGGGFIAGLFTRGRVRDGAVAGAVCGVLVALIAATFTSLAARDPSFLSTFAFYALIFTGLLLPYNAIGGAAGRAVRSALRRDGAAGAGERGGWHGIAVGTVVIVGLALVPGLLVVITGLAPVSGLLGLLVVAAPLAGGFIAGYASGGRPKDGLKAGFVAALFGAGLLFFIPLLWTALHDFGFVDMFEGMVAIALVYFFTLFGAAAGVAGAVVRQSFGVEEADGEED